METITIEKTYTKKEAFVRFMHICNGLPKSSDQRCPGSEYEQLVKFLGLEENGLI